MQLGRAHTAAVRHAHDEGKLHLAAGPPPVAPHVRDQLVEAGIREGVVLHLAHGAPARHAEPDGGAEDARLGERRVEAAVRSEAVAQSCGRSEDAARTADVLAHHHHRRVTLELDVEAVVDRLDDGTLSQACLAARRDRSRTTRADRRAHSRTAARRRPAGSASASLMPSRISSAASARIDATRSSCRIPARRQIALEAADALALLLLLDPLEVDVRAGIVGRRVRRGPVGHRLDEGRPFTGSRTRDRLARRLVAGEDIGPVDAQPRDAVADSLVGKRLRTRLRLDGSRDRPAVVVAEQDQRRAGDACEVRAFVERALGRRTVAEEGDRTRRARPSASSPRRARPRAARASRSERRSKQGGSPPGSTSPRDVRATTRARSPPASRAAARSPTRGRRGRSSPRRRAHGTRLPASPRGSRRSRRCRSAPGGGRRPNARRRCAA